MTRENKRNYYRILHVQADAPLEIIRSSYRTLMQRLKMHPDLGGDHWDAALINEAYATLSDPSKREEYDRNLTAFDRETATSVVDDALNERRHVPEPAPHVAVNRCPFCQHIHGPLHNIDADKLCSACGSPLCPAEPPNHETSWMRKVDRFPKDKAVTFYTRWPQPDGHSGRLRDMSLTGMQFATDQQVGINQFLKIECDVCSTIARVVHCRPQAGALDPLWLVGVEFFTLRFEQSRGAFVSARA
jgi:hypothetical protein